MTDPGMIERMARAICHAEAKPYGVDEELRLWLANRHVYENIARAALLAMREPTLAAAVVGFETMQSLGLECEGRDASRVWLAMIDAALAEKP